MKRLSILALALTAALGLSGCSERAAALGNGENVANDPNSITELAAALTAGEKKELIDEDGFEHKLSEGDNSSDNELCATCGNTQTTISRNTRMGGEPAESSFMYEDSVALTNLLLKLDYSGDVCKCLPEYYVKTEFSQDRYEVSLSEGYVRFNGGQVSLTAEQLELIHGIIDRQLK